MRSNLEKAANDYYPSTPFKIINKVYGLVLPPISIKSSQSIEQLMMRGIVISHETVCEWGLKFGQTYANEIKRRAPRRGTQWHMFDYAR